MLTRADDQALLNMLDLRHNEGLDLAVVIERTGMSRGSVCGSLKRIRDSELPCECRKMKNKNGGMSRFWWRK